MPSPSAATASAPVRWSPRGTSIWSFSTSASLYRRVQALQAVRTTHPATVLLVVMATALGQSEMVVKALGMGANDYVTKPYDLAVLLARVQTHLALKRMVEEKTLLDTAHSPNETRAWRRRTGE